jgi:hypothetical protein
MFTEARYLAKYIGPGASPPTMHYRTLSFSKTDLLDVINFVLSERNCSGLSWGCKTHVTAEGDNLVIPRYQRQFSPEIMWKKYKHYKSSNQEALCIKRNSFLSITKIITGGQSTSFAALDNIYVRFGYENFKKIENFIKEIAELFPDIPQAVIQAVVQRVQGD